MIVVGGTYEEICVNPTLRITRGSGLRAAIALRATGDVELHSSIEESAEDLARVTAGGFGITPLWTRRTAPVRFRYFTPLSAPIIDGRLSSLRESINVTGELALVFGMVEGGPSDLHVRSDKMVVDPQQPRDLTGLRVGDLEHNQLVIVANATETRALGGLSDLLEAAGRLRAETGADAVITKQAAVGVLVTTETHQERVGPFPTRSVWPVGTGDVFAAAFTWSWGKESATPIEAARFAGAATARWAASRDQEDPLTDASSGVRFEELKPATGPQIYLAGPFFDLGQRWLVDLLAEAIRGLGAEVFSPWHEVGVGGPEVAASDIEGLEHCNAVLALLDGADAGTMFEVGYATSRGTPVIGYAERQDTEGWKMLKGTGAEIHTDLSTAAYRAIWYGMGMQA